MSETSVDETEWRGEIEHHREQKDAFFADHPQSPIPRGRRSAFEGLDYYPPDPDYRVVATVTRHDDPEQLVMETTTGEQRTYARAVTFTFEIDGEEQTLAGYRRVDDHEEGIFLPFRDETSGEETYGAGRYLDLEVDWPVEDGEEVVLDFNLAYSPFCAYNDHYSCPLTPMENWLEVPIEAGERYDPDAMYGADGDADAHGGGDGHDHGHDH